MANSKPPHERLREWADTCAYPSTEMTVDMIRSGEISGSMDAIKAELAAFRKFADEVEDAIESAYMDGTCHYFDMIADEQGWPERKADELVEDYVKRCFMVKVLDADGVPIEVGDVLFRKTDGLRVIVADIRGDNFIDGERCGFVPRYFTHREPDTFEKAMDCFQSILEDKDGLDYEAEDKLWEVHKRLTAIMERDAE